MIRFYKIIESFWFERISEKIRFLLVGGFNTALSYALFSGCFFMFSGNYLAAVIVQYVISVNISILTMRYYVFQSKGNFLREYAKAGAVYTGILLFNMLWLFIFIETYAVGAFVSQALYLIVSTIITYLFHKFFSFSKKQ